MEKKVFTDELEAYSYNMRREEINKYATSIDYEEFKLNSELNKTLVESLKKTCIYEGFIGEVYHTLKNFTSHWDYFYRLTVAIFLVEESGIPNFTLLNFEIDDKKTVDVMYYLYNYFYRTGYIGKKCIPIIEDTSKLYKPKLLFGYVKRIKSILRGSKTNENFRNQINPYRVSKELYRGFEYRSDIKAYCTEEEIVDLENLFSEVEKMMKKMPREDLMKCVERVDGITQSVVKDEYHMLGQVSNINDINRNQGFNKYFSEMIINSNQENIYAQILSVGMKFKNYRALCNLLGEKEVGGKQQQIQIKRWQRYFAFHKEGHAIIIDSIYDKPHEKVDGRVNNKGGNNSVYVEDIERVIIGMLNKNSIIQMSYTQLFERLGFVNKEYSSYKYNRNHLSKDLNISGKIIDKFCKIVYTRAKDNTNNTLDVMVKKGYCKYKHITMIRYNGSDKYKEASEEELSKIKQLEGIIIKEMGLKDMSEVLYKNAWIPFNEKLLERLGEEMEIDIYYKHIRIWRGENFDSIDNNLLLNHTEAYSKKRINLNFCKRLLESNEKKRSKILESDVLYLDYLWGKTFDGKTVYDREIIEEDYLESIEQLVEILIQI